MYGTYALDGWRKTDLIVDPILVVPGIMGSAQIGGVWNIDPIAHTYDDLLASLQKNGFVANKNLFLFPYDWRVNNSITAFYLQEKIESILLATKISKVDVVAHSMGGLVVRAYIENVGSASYADTIDQLVTLGTPHKGSPHAYLRWEAGEGFFSLQDKILKHHFEQEAEHAGFEKLGEYIRAKVPSVKDLLPDYSYLSDGQNQRQYPENYPRNQFLEELNRSDKLEKLTKVDHTNISGNLDEESTISKIRVVDSSLDGSWQHGMPENFYSITEKRGFEYGYGDETVPVESGEFASAQRKISFNASHQDLPTKAQCEVVRELTNREECKYIDNPDIVNILMINVFSPVDIQIISPSGKRIGKNFKTGEIFNEIQDAFYTGFETKNEFITIPNPEDGEYEVLTQGTGSGEYRVEVARIENKEGNQEVQESTLNISGEASEGKEESVKVEVAGNLITNLNQPISEPVDLPVIPPIVPVQQPVDSGTDNGNAGTATPEPVKDEKSAKKKKSKKKNKKNKKKKKSKLKTTLNKAKKVVTKSISSKNGKQNIFAKSWQNVSKNTSSAWKSVRKAPDKIKELFSNKFSFFKIKK